MIPTLPTTRYTSGSSYTGDFALDDIRVGDCLTIGCVTSNDCFTSSCDSTTGRCSFETVKTNGTWRDVETTPKSNGTML